MVRGRRMSGGKLRAFIDLSRVHGSPIITGFFLAGMLSGAAVPHVSYFILAAVVGFLFKSAGSVHNELLDLDMDARDPVLRKKPIQAGIISRREARGYLAGCLLAGTAASLLFFPPVVTGLVLLAAGLIFFYNALGKFVPVAYEMLFAASMAILVIAGAFLAGGAGKLTYVLAFTVFCANLLAQWLNGCRDIETDRPAGVASLPALFEGRPDGRTLTALSGAAIWTLFTGSLLLPFLLSVLGAVYLPWTLGIHAGISFHLFRGLPAASSRRAFNRLLVVQVVAFWLIVPVFLVDAAGWAAVFGLCLFTMLGTVVAIAAEKATQYKLAFSGRDAGSGMVRAGGGVDG
ncbi:MAG: hypothetical protein FJ149_10670 [Euryarchaeota archaeon]|nr:hypothetical protein [Euryarchaeota archaeon]